MYSSAANDAAEQSSLLLNELVSLATEEAMLFLASFALHKQQHQFTDLESARIRIYGFHDSSEPRSDRQEERAPQSVKIRCQQGVLLEAMVELVPTNHQA